MDKRQQFEQLNKAITAIELGAQSYKLGSKSIQKADLATLYKERNNIEKTIAEDENFQGVTVAVFDRR